MAKEVQIGRIIKKITTPVGVAIYPRLNSPNTKFKPEGRYEVKLKLEGDDAAEFQAMVEAFEVEAHTEAEQTAGKKLKLAQHKVCNPMLDDQGNEVPETIIAKFKLNASGTSKSGEKWKRKVTVVDAKRKPLFEIVGGGSKVKIAGTLKAYYTGALGFGISAELRAVQVLELVEHTGGFSIDEFEDEDGFQGAGKPQTDEDDDGAGAADSDF